jgi:hypothetical protein
VLALKLKERRRSPRQLINRAAKLQAANGALPRDCLITNMSHGGVRLHIEGAEVPDRFVLLISAEGEKPRPRDCRVIWRLGFEVGVEFVGFEPRLA